MDYLFIVVTELYCEFFLNNTKKINSPIKHICFEVKKLDNLQKKLKKFDKNIKVKRGKLITFYNL